MKFKTTLLQAGKTATGIEVPAKIVESFGAGKKPPVRVTINGYTYQKYHSSDGRSLHGRRKR